MKYTAKKNTTVGELLKIHYAGSSNSTLKNYFRKNQIKVNDQLVKTPETIINAGDVMEVLKEGELPKKNLPFKIVHEDDAIIVVEKPVGVLTSGEGITKRETLHKMIDNYLQEKTKGKVHAFVVHRLDKEVIGLVLFAKSEIIVQKLQDNWKKFTKKYLALSMSAPPKPEGTVDTWLIERNLKMNVVHQQIDGAVHAITHYKWLRFEKKFSLFEVTLDTGKKNQIRVHLSHMGCPIIGDRKYDDTFSENTNVRLMAAHLEIDHPVTGKRMVWKLEPTVSFLRP